jgi:hypothetical protein
MINIRIADYDIVGTSLKETLLYFCSELTNYAKNAALQRIQRYPKYSNNHHEKMPD